jgi:GT2 family glycosyltransferase
MIQVSVIIVNYNTFQVTCNCIESIICYTKEVSYEIVLVDNASSECDADDFLKKFPGITLVKSPVNGGFAKGNNLGIAASKGKIVLLLNSDTYLQEDCISESVLYYESQSNIGVLGIKMIYPDGRIQHTARKFRSVSWEWLDLLRFIPMLLPYTKRAKLMLGKYFKSDFDMECDWLNGAYFMFSRSILPKKKGEKLDERFFMYGEDHLWCYQIQQLGYKNYFLSTAEVVHINNASTKKQNRLRLILVMINHELQIMQQRVGKGLYYYTFCSIYLFKEYARYAVKYVVYNLSGRVIR